MPLYIHPRTPSQDMTKPFVHVACERAFMGFGVEVAFHIMDIVVNGALDQFPNLKLMIGHAGEGLPYWMYRLDYTHESTWAGRSWPKLKMHPSDYMQRNLWITSSGVPWGPALKLRRNFSASTASSTRWTTLTNSARKRSRMSDNFDMTPAVKKKFFQGNIEDLTGIRA